MSERVQSGRARQGRVGGVVMVQCVDFRFLNTIMLQLWSVCHIICKGNRYFWTLDHSNTPIVMEGGCEIYPLRQHLSWLYRSDNSKHDCTGGKFILVPEYLTERDILWLILKRKSHTLP